MRSDKFLAFLIALLFLAAAGPALAEEGLCNGQAPTAQGPVIGKAVEGEPVCAYLGIPFAAAPVGKLRWRPPAPAPQREKPFEAFAFGPQCVQRGTGTGIPAPGAKPTRSEDCLNLNVWRPAKSGTFPVMVWIHGGSLTGGSGSETLYWGDRLAAGGDVVVVTINYRLSYYGFLALPGLSAEDAHGSSGNYGLLDQIAALGWVKDNIAGFGGDPQNVTIFGESAGGWSVCNLLASPLAAGLFHKAILESGGCDTVSTLDAGYQIGEEWTKKVGCAPKDLACLRGKSPEEIYAALDAKAKEEKKSGSPISLESARMDWTPRVDKWVLNETPIEALTSGRFNQVPFMVGSNRDEFKLFTIAMPGIRSAPKALFRPLLAEAFGQDFITRFEQLYPYQKYRKPMDAVLDAIGDMALGCKCFDAAEAVSTRQPVYYYRFDYDAHLLPHLIGAAHGLEIPFIFNNLDRPPANLFLDRRLTKKAQPLAAAMLRYWTNFARTGNPNGQGLLEWPVYTQASRMRMIFDLPLRVTATDNVQKCEFWSQQNIRLTD